jgi:hypothetical protein
MTSVKPLIGVSVFSMSPCTCLRNSRSSDPRCVPSHAGPPGSAPDTRLTEWTVQIPRRGFLPDPSFTGIPICRFPIRWSSDGPLTCHLSSRVAHMLSTFIGKSHIAISRCLMHLFTGLTKLRFPMAYLPRSFCRSDGCRRRSAAIIRAHPKFNHTLIFLPEKLFFLLCLILFHQ